MYKNIMAASFGISGSSGINSGSNGDSSQIPLPLVKNHHESDQYGNSNPIDLTTDLPKIDRQNRQNHHHHQFQQPLNIEEENFIYEQQQQQQQPRFLPKILLQPKKGFKIQASPKVVSKKTNDKMKSDRDSCSNNYYNNNNNGKNNIRNFKDQKMKNKNISKRKFDCLRNEGREGEDGEKEEEMATPNAKKSKKTTFSNNIYYYHYSSAGNADKNDFNNSSSLTEVNQLRGGEESLMTTRRRRQNNNNNKKISEKEDDIKKGEEEEEEEENKNGQNVETSRKSKEDLVRGNLDLLMNIMFLSVVFGRHRELSRHYKVLKMANEIQNERENIKYSLSLPTYYTILTVSSLGENNRV